MLDRPVADDVQLSAIETAIEMRASGDLPGAIRFLYDELAQDIGNQELYTTLATMLAENGEFDRADRIFQRAFTAGLDTPGLRLNYAAFQASSGQDGNYVEVFRGMGAKLTHVLAHLVLDDPASAFAEDIWRFGMAECNLARVRLQEGNLDAARDLAEKWLFFPRVWSAAHDVVVACIEDGDEGDAFADLHADARASPAMIAWMVENTRLADQRVAVRVAGTACNYLKWDWIADLDDEFAVVLRELLDSVKPEAPVMDGALWESIEMLERLLAGA